MRGRSCDFFIATALDTIQTIDGIQNGIASTLPSIMENAHDQMTIGMHLDALLESMDSLSSTQLYGIIVLFTVGISFLLLGSGGDVSDGVVASLNQKKSPPAIQQKGRQPKWFVLKWLNYAAIVGFVASVAKAAMHAYLEDSFSLVQYLIGWSFFLLYFFGFFGISFIDAEELAMGASTRYVMA